MTTSLTVRGWLREPGGAPPLPARTLTCGPEGITTAPAAAEADPSGRLALPAPVNAHDHGYGIRTLDFGCFDDALEPWIAGLRLRPRTDPELEALVAFGRIARSGCSATMHCHNSLNVDRLVEEAGAVVRAAGRVGIRFGLSCPLLDDSPFVYGGLDHLADTTDAADLSWLRGQLADYAPIREQIAAVEAIARAHQSAMVDVQYGPIGPQWCSDGLLEAIAEASAATGRRVHMHLLESPRQRAWLDRRFADGVVTHLDRIGLLSPRLTIAHGVQLTEAEIDRLAERGVKLASNPSANLRLRSGIAPQAAIHGAMDWSVGLDGTGFDDRQDIWHEMRLFQLLHGGDGLSPALSAGTVLSLARKTGARIIGVDIDTDVVAVDWAALSADSMFDDIARPEERLLARMRADLVTDLVVAGRHVVEHGKLTGFDFEAARSELVNQARADAAGLGQRRAEAARIAAIVRSHYRALGHR